MMRYPWLVSLSCTIVLLQVPASLRAGDQDAKSKPTTPTGSGGWQVPGEIQQPKGTWQVPGEIQKPKGTWQVPGEIQIPKGIQAIRVQDDKCQQRLSIGADALFEFDQSTLTPDAKETLEVLGPLIQEAGKHPVHIEGHTDAIGTDEYNQHLSEMRARSVKNWLAEHQFVPEAAAVRGFGEQQPVAPNTKDDGSDNPDGRQLNRRVEVIIDTCK